MRGSPRSSLAHRNLGVTLQLDGDVDGAQRDCTKRPRRLNPTEPVVHNNLGVIFLRKPMADAERELRKELAINPRYPQAHHKSRARATRPRSPGRAAQELAKAARLQQCSIVPLGHGPAPAPDAECCFVLHRRTRARSRLTPEPFSSTAISRWRGALPGRARYSAGWWACQPGLRGLFTPGLFWGTSIAVAERAARERSAGDLRELWPGKRAALFRALRAKGPERAVSAPAAGLGRALAATSNVLGAGRRPCRCVARSRPAQGV